ncbi:MAG: putative membrane protein YdjX (TVP38/TMEM64 family) [Dinoroseobacter sp.]|jgi:uncharacterized membrane protein YdjX (TVP38/TMEM64 family)
MFSWNNKQRAIYVIHLAFLLMVIVPFLLWDQATHAFVTHYLVQAGDLEIASMVIMLLTLDVFFPVPSSVVGTVSGLLLGWGFGFLSTFIGLMLGSLVGFAVGHLFRHTFFHRYFADDEFRQVSYDLANYGFLLLIAFRGIPILAEMSVLASGFHRYSFSWFFIAMLFSNSILAAIHAYLGVNAANTDSDYFFALSFLVVPVAGYAFRLYLNQRQTNVIES